MCGVYFRAEDLENNNNNMNMNMNNNSKLYVTLLAMLITLAIGTLIPTIQNSGHFLSMVQPICFSLSTCLMIIDLCSIHYNREKLRSFLFSLDGHFYRYNDDRDDNYNFVASDTLRLIRNILIVRIYVVFYSIIIAPTIALLKGKPTTLIYPCWIPWSLDTTLSYVFTYVLQTILMSSIATVYYANHVLTIMTALEYRDQYRKLNGKVKNLPWKKTPNELVTDDGRRYEKIFADNLIECILHQRKLTEAFNNLKPWFDINFSLNLTTCTFTICLIMFCVLEEKNLSLLITYVETIGHFSSTLFVQCYIGELFYEFNNSVKESLYDTEWYRQPLHIQKLIHIFQLQLDRPLQLRAFFIYNASYYIFSQFAKTSYSFFNLMRKVNSK